MKFDSDPSGASFKHDLFIEIEKMTLEESKNKGENLIINYGFYKSQFGDILIASSLKGICHISFVKHQSEGLSVIKKIFPNSKFQQEKNLMQQEAFNFFNRKKINFIKLNYI